MKKEMYRVLIIIAICVLSALAMRAATPVDAADGVDVLAGNPVRWVTSPSETVMGSMTATDWNYLSISGGNHAEIAIVPGTSSGQHIRLSPWSTTYGGLLVYNNHAEMQGSLSVITSIDSASVDTDTLQVNDSANIDGNVTVDGAATITGATTVTGAISGSNLSGTNTGDQTIQLMFGGNGANAQTAASSTTYMGPFFTGAPETAEYDVIWNAPKVCTLGSFYVRTRSTQPGTGSLMFVVRLDNSNTSIITTVAAGAAAGLFSDTTHSAAIAYAGQRVSVSVVNNATSSSAKIASWSLSCAAQ